MAAPWSTLPAELQRLIFRRLAAELNAENHSDGGMSLAAAGELLHSLSICREWRAAAMQEVQLRIRIDSHQELASPLLGTIRCRELRLPGSPGALPQPAWEAAVAGLLGSARFRASSGGCLAALLGVPLPVLASGALAAFPHLACLDLVGGAVFSDDSCPLRAVGASGRCFPPALHTLRLPEHLLRMRARGAASSLPSSLQRLEPWSRGSMIITAGALRACPSIEARAVGTATVHVEAFLQRGVRCKELALHARAVVFSSPTEDALVYAHCSPPVTPHVLATWLHAIEPLALHAGLRRLQMACNSVSLYCRQTGQLASLEAAQLPRQRACVMRASGHAMEAELSWPAAGQPPAFFCLTISAADA